MCELPLVWKLGLQWILKNERRDSLKNHIVCLKYRIIDVYDSLGFRVHLGKHFYFTGM